MLKNTQLPIQNTLQSKGAILDLSKPVVMGIININDASFYANSRITNTEQVLEKATQMLAEGAAIIDLGAASSKPGEPISSPEKEIEVLIPAIELIKKKHPTCWISIDTYHSQVARASVQAGANIINDISAGLIDNAMLSSVAELQVPYCMMHLKGTPETMQANCHYDNLEASILEYFMNRIQAAESCGIKDIIVDPGFGFSKNTKQNFELLKELRFLELLGKPILVGLSRKSMIYKTLACTAAEALNGTSALHVIALQQGAKILRVHDVKEAVEVIKLMECL
jgi:dihydropteroate synthase